MTFGNNIMFSAVVHMTIVTAALALAGRDAALRVPEEYVMVTLIGHAETLQKGTGEEWKERPAGEPAQPVKRKRLQEPAAVPAPVPEWKESTPVPLSQKEISSQDDSGPAKGGQAEVAVSARGDQGGGSWRTSSGTLPGNEARKDGPGTGKDGAGGSDASVLSAIRTAIERAKIYPALAKRRNQEGTVVAEFSINARGLPENVSVTRSSGFGLLDSAARETIVKAAPFPVVSGRIEVLISFVLK